MHSAEIQASRRQFLMATAAGMAGLALSGKPVQAGADPFAGFKIGLQSYSLRGFDFATALKHSQTLGLKTWETFPNHVPLSTLPATVQAAKKAFADAGISLMSYGVLSFTPNENEARSYFDFAKAMGLVAIAADPQPNRETFDLLDRLVEEYDIAIAIHNHGPGHRYDKADDVLKWVKDRHPKIGACVDTGHYLRSNENPVEVIQKFGARVHGVHLKDVRTINKPEDQEKLASTLAKHRVGMLKQEGKIFTILGEGELDTVGVLKALKKLNYKNCIALEYEENEQNPLSDLEICLRNVKAAIKKV